MDRDGENENVETHKNSGENKGIANNMGGKSAKRFLRQSDEDNLNNRINGIPSLKRVDALLRVLVRIEALETSIENNASMSAERKARLLGLLDEVRTFIQERLDALVGSGSTSEDITAPVLSNFAITGVSTTGATLRVHSGESGTGYFVVVLSGSVSPTAMQVKSGQNGMSGSALASGSGSLTKGTTHFSVTNLVPNTAYVVYFVATDLRGNMTATPMSATLTTLLTPDTVPPVINSLTSTGTTSTGTTLVVNVSESGTGYYVVLPNGSAVPTALQIKAGKDALGAAASIKGLGATLSGSNNIPVAGLSPSSTVSIFFTAEDTSGNLQPIPQTWSITTLP